LVGFLQKKGGEQKKEKIEDLIFVEGWRWVLEVKPQRRKDNAEAHALQEDGEKHNVNRVPQVFVVCKVTERSQTLGPCLFLFG